MTVSPEVLSLRDELIARRRDLHRHPELAFEETRTARLVAQELTALGMDVTTGVAKTGVVGLWGNPEAKAVLLRADMDALPLQEESEVDYSSCNAGVMHACGHDGHTAMLLGAAKLLTAEPKPEDACYKIVFQPAEEGGGGAKVMIGEGILANPEVEFAVAAHLWNDMPAGNIGVRAGPTLASADHFRVTLTGSGGHGAMPHETKDPIVAAAELIVAWQTVVSRNVDPLQPAVLTVGSIHAGTVGNIIPGEVIMTGTIRAFDGQARELIVQRMKSLLAGVASAHGLTFELDFTTGYPSTVNAAEACTIVRAAAAEVVGPERVLEQNQVMGAEDFAFFLQKAPGCFFVVGSRNEGKGLTAPHHNSRFDFDEEALLIGVDTMVRSARRFAAELSAKGDG